MLTSFATTTAVLLRPSESLEWGQQVADWESPQRIAFPGCADYGLSGPEQAQGKDVSSSTRQLFIPLTLEDGSPKARDIDGNLVRPLGTDRVEHLGHTWEIVGEPTPQISPSGSLSHFEVLLKRWDGKK